MTERTDLTGLNLELDHKYAVEGAVHRGPMATTYTASWTLFDLPVTIRFYDSLMGLRLRHRDATRIRWTIESEAGKVRGRHLPDALDAGVHHQMEPFLVLRLPPGELLSQRLDRVGRLPLTNVVDIVNGVASALADCREQAEPHRGPTVDRVWIGDGDEVLLLGYGEVLFREDTLTMGGFPTTELVWHIPPESFQATQAHEASDEGGRTRSTSLRMIARGPAAASDRSLETDPRAEVYALGCLAYQALQGHHPFFTDRSDLPEGIQATLLREAMDLEDFGTNHPVARAIFQAIARDPQQRFATPAAFAAALTQAAGGRATRSTASAVPPSLPEHDLVDDGDALELFGEYSDELQPAGRRGDVAQLWLWRLASAVLAIALGLVLAKTNQQRTALMITSTPAGLELGRVNGHVREALGRTPLVLQDEPVGRTLRLFAIGPDGVAGPVVEVTPSAALQLGQCRRIDLDLEYTAVELEGSGTPL